MIAFESGFLYRGRRDLYRGRQKVVATSVFCKNNKKQY